MELELHMAGLQDVEDEYEVSAKATSDFLKIMAGVDLDWPFEPVVSIMPCGGWRADWFVQEPAISVRLIVSADEGVHPVIFVELEGQYGVEVAETYRLNQHLKWLEFIMRNPVTITLVPYRQTPAMPLSGLTGNAYSPYSQNQHEH